LRLEFYQTKITYPTLELCKASREAREAGKNPSFLMRPHPPITKKRCPRLGRKSRYYEQSEVEEGPKMKKKKIHPESVPPTGFKEKLVDFLM
jgi:hypothetical protein